MRKTQVTCSQKQITLITGDTEDTGETWIIYETEKAKKQEWRPLTLVRGKNPFRIVSGEKEEWESVK